MQHYIENKVIIITGGSSGFGLATARILLEMGARVVITGRNAERLAQAESELDGGPNLLGVTADANLTTDWKKLIQQVISKWDRIDVLVLNHGGGIKITDTENMDDETIHKVIETNLTSSIRGAREVIPQMKNQGSGHIITVSSACAHHSWAEWGTYTAAKAGLVGFTKCLHMEMGAWGGKATVFTPGAARTGFANAAGLDSDWQTDLPDSTDFARALVNTIDLPANTFVEEVKVWGTAQVPGMVNPF